MRFQLSTRSARLCVVSALGAALLLASCTVENTNGGAVPQTASPTRTAPPTPAPAAADPSAAPTVAGARATSPSQKAGAVSARGAAGQPAQVQAQRAAAAPSAQGSQNPAVSVYQRNGASVVNITSLAVVSSRSGQSAQQPQGIGSGFIIDQEGRILTNNHVIQEADQLTVTFQDKTTVPATLLGRDAPNDLAVIQVDPNATDDAGVPIRDRIVPVALGDSTQVVIGEDAIAIGSPLGLQQSVTSGIVSAIRNPGEESASPRTGAIDLLGGAIQTDASINPGNSGGPLFNAAGEVIGVNSAILSQSGGNEGIGFAIPINVAKRVAPELIQNGRYRHPLIGVATISLSRLGQQLKQQLGLPQNLRGLLVQESSAGAQQAGIRAGTRRMNVGGNQLLAGGDIIVAIDGQPVVTEGELRGYVENNKHPGQTTVITIVRDGQRQDVTVELSERPQTNP